MGACNLNNERDNEEGSSFPYSHLAVPDYMARNCIHDFTRNFPSQIEFAQLERSVVAGNFGQCRR